MEANIFKRFCNSKITKIQSNLDVYVNVLAVI